MKSKSMFVASFLTVAILFAIGILGAWGTVVLAAWLENVTGVRDVWIWTIMIAVIIFALAWNAIYKGLIDRGYK